MKKAPKMSIDELAVRWISFTKKRLEVFSENPGKLSPLPDNLAGESRLLIETAILLDSELDPKDMLKHGMYLSERWWKHMGRKNIASILKGLRLSSSL